MPRFWDKEYSLLLPKYSNPADEGGRQQVSGKAIERYATKMAKHFGGVQVDELLGCGTDPRGTLICEEMYKLVSARDNEAPKAPKSLADFSSYEHGVAEVRRQKKDEEDAIFINKLATNAGKEFGQWAIMTQKDEQDVEFVEGPSRTTIYKRAVEKQSLSSLL